MISSVFLGQSSFFMLGVFALVIIALAGTYIIINE